MELSIVRSWGPSLNTIRKKKKRYTHDQAIYPGEFPLEVKWKNPPQESKDHIEEDGILSLQMCEDIK